MRLIKFIETLASQAVPSDDAKYLWFDSKGITSSQDMLCYEDAKPFIGFLYDSWLRPVSLDRREALDEAC